MRLLLGRLLHQASRFQRRSSLLPPSPLLSPAFRLPLQRCKHGDSSADKGDHPEKATKLAEARKLLPNRYQVFEDKDTEIIFDDSVDLDVILNQKQKKPKRASLTESDDDSKLANRKASGQLRGQRGVFDIEELVALLREENMTDIATIKVPEELKYCEYMVLCTAASAKHIRRFVETLNQLYKIKKSRKDPFLNLNDASNDWRLVDLQNIVLNVFLAETRAYYDIETLWTVGEQFDDKVQRPEDGGGSSGGGNVVEDILQRHISFLESQAAAANKNLTDSSN